MRIVFIADDGPANTWILGKVQRFAPVAAIIQPDWDAPRPADAPPSSTSARRTAPFGTRVIRRLRSGYFAPRDRGASMRLARHLSIESLPPAPTAAVMRVPAWDINGSATLDLLRGLAPDLMVVSGAPLLLPAIYTVPRLGAVNLHFGISPDYRGMHTITVPWLAGDYANIGATLHIITAGIDAGPVLFRVYPALSHDDDVVSVEAKIVRLAASTLCDFFEQLDTDGGHDSLTGAQLSGTGRLVRYHDRSIRDDLRYRLRRALGAPVPSLPERVERFYPR